MEETARLAALCRFEWTAETASLVPIESVDVERVVGAARRHGVCGWLYRRLTEEGIVRDSSYREIAGRLRASVLETIAKNGRREAVYRAIRERMREKGMEIVPLKGIYLMRELYDEIWERPTSDIDLLAYGTNPMAVYREMLKMVEEGRVPKYRTQAVYDTMFPHYPPMMIGGQAVDLHFCLFGRESRLNVGEVETEVRGEEGRGERVLTDAQTMYHLTAHYVKNRQIEGNRLGWLVDIALMMKRQGEKGREMIARVEAMNRGVVREMRETWSEAFWLLGEEERREAESIIEMATKQPTDASMAPWAVGMVGKYSDIAKRLWRYIEKSARYVIEENDEKTRIDKLKAVTLDLKDFVRERGERKKR